MFGVLKLRLLLLLLLFLLQSDRASGRTPTVDGNQMARRPLDGRPTNMLDMEHAEIVHGCTNMSQGEFVTVTLSSIVLNFAPRL
jgi:hypothetical protein